MQNGNSTNRRREKARLEEVLLNKWDAIKGMSENGHYVSPSSNKTVLNNTSVNNRLSVQKGKATNQADRQYD